MRILSPAPVGGKPDDRDARLPSADRRVRWLGRLLADHPDLRPLALRLLAPHLPLFIARLDGREARP
jgi:hypothetical protein